MKTSSVYFTGACAILVIIACAVGCTGSVNPNAHIVTPPSYAPEECPIPPLIFNDSMEITVLHTGLVIAKPGTFNGTDAYPIPEGSIIYHSRGWITRIFDADGRQILIVNDTQSYVTGPTGYSASSTEFPYFSDNLTVKGNGKKIQYFINGSNRDHPCNFIQVYDNWTSPYHPHIPLDH
jgi:hypothetical protein